MKIGNLEISNKRMFVIAEAGVNHDGNFDQAVRLIHAAKDSGADAVKFQAFTAEGLCDVQLEETKDVEHLTGGTKSSYEMYKALEFSEEELKALKEIADGEGILFSASVFDETRATFLNQLDVPFFKVSSGDLTHIPLLIHLAQFRKPIILSTGMALMQEVLAAREILFDAGLEDIVFLHCTSDYPPKEDEVNLKAILAMQRALGQTDALIGYSDHTIGLEIPFALAGMRIPVLEKHFTLDEDLPGPDHKLSLGPQNFKKMVQGVRKIEKAMGNGIKAPTPQEEINLKTTRRGVKAARVIRKGERISLTDIRLIKPATGIRPEKLQEIIGREVKKPIQINQPIEIEDLV